MVKAVNELTERQQNITTRVPLTCSLIPFIIFYSFINTLVSILKQLLFNLDFTFLGIIYLQRFDERIQKRRLEYAEVEQKVEMHVPFYEVQSLMLDRGKKLMVMQKRMEKMLKNPETKDNTMSMEKFYDRFEEWLDATTRLMDDPYSLDNSITEYNEVMELLLEEKHKLLNLIHFMMEHASGEVFFKEDGSQDVSAIERFFDCIDIDKDGSITPTELKNFIMEVNYHEILVDDEMSDIIVRHLDIDGNGDIDKQEFISGFKKWLTEIYKHSHGIYRRSNRYKQDKPKERADAEAKAKANAKAKAKMGEKYKAIILLIVGICMLTFLAEPLVESVRKFSDSVNIEPFYVSFILVPLATNARTAIAAIRAAKQKSHQTTSLTFSEIYHKVFMNNILGFCVLVSVIYFRGLTWHFSAEILVVIIVCMIMGLLASFRSKFPNWTLLIAFALYPLSLVVVYFVNDAFQFS